VGGVGGDVSVEDCPGLLRTCAINLDHVQTVPKDKIGGLLTRLSAERMTKVRSALLFALGFRE